MKEKIYNVFADYGENLILRLPDILIGVALLVVLVVVGRLISRILLNRLSARLGKSVLVTFLAQITKWVFNAIGLLIALDYWGFGKFATSLVASAGISAIIIGFAFKDIAENFLAGLLLAFHRPFKIGDIIEVDSTKGPVVELEMRSTHIRVADGRDIWIPNALIIKSILTNYTRDGLLRHEFMVGLATEDDIEKARNLILNYFQGNSEVLDKPQPNVLVHEIGVSSIDLKVNFWIDMYRRNIQPEERELMGEPARSRVLREVKDLLLENGFSLPSHVLEHKMYQSDEPLQVAVNE